MYILNDLWYGNIRPYERSIRPGTEYQMLSDELSKQLTAFAKNLSPDAHDQYKNIEDLRMKLHLISEEDTFITGFRMGARLILDIICDHNGQFETFADT